MCALIIPAPRPQNALGGNSKTIMIAAISPADYNYSESLSTLSYANRVLSIKTTATVNEDPKVKLIKDLKAQVAVLQRQAASGLDAEGQEKLDEYKRLMEEKDKTWEAKLRESEERARDAEMQLSETGAT